MDSIPPFVWGLAAIGFAFWYVFMRGGKKSSKQSLMKLDRE